MQGFQQHNVHIKFGLHQSDDEADMQKNNSRYSNLRSLLICASTGK